MNSYDKIIQHMFVTFTHYVPLWFMSAVILHVVGSLHAHHVSQITLMSVASSSGLSSGKEAPVASSAGIWGCKSNDVVWCVEGPHMGSLLILPRHFNWVCKVLSCQKQSEFDSMKSNADLRRPHSGHSYRRSINVCEWVSVPTWWQGGQFGLRSVAGEVITAYPITRGWKCCQPLSQCFPLRVIICDRTPIAPAYHDYWSWQSFKVSPLMN